MTALGRFKGTISRDKFVFFLEKLIIKIEQIKT